MLLSKTRPSFLIRSCRLLHETRWILSEVAEELVAATVHESTTEHVAAKKSHHRKEEGAKVSKITQKPSQEKKKLLKTFPIELPVLNPQHLFDFSEEPDVVEMVEQMANKDLHHAPLYALVAFSKAHHIQMSSRKQRDLINDIVRWRASHQDEPEAAEKQSLVVRNQLLVAGYPQKTLIQSRPTGKFDNEREREEGKGKNLVLCGLDLIIIIRF
jgi:hypothetical protein